MAAALRLLPFSLGLVGGPVSALSGQTGRQSFNGGLLSEAVLQASGLEKWRLAGPV
jgi:hypothetical protein